LSSKVYRIIIVLLVGCLSVSLGFDGFLYMQTLDLHRQVKELTEQVTSLNAQINNMANTRNFTFELPRDAGDFLRMELTFKIVEENLSITAILDHELCSLIIVFDRDGDGEIEFADDGWILYYANNYHPTHVDVVSGTFIIPRMLPWPSPYHNVTRSENVTSFYVMFPLNMLNLHNDLVYISEESVDGRGVLFHFDLEV